MEIYLWVRRAMNRETTQITAPFLNPHEKSLPFASPVSGNFEPQPMCRRGATRDGAAVDGYSKFQTLAHAGDLHRTGAAAQATSIGAVVWRARGPRGAA